MFFVYIVLGILFLMIVPGTVEILFHDLRYRRYLLKKANKAILEAQSWKSDVEYFLEVIKKKGPITFSFEGSQVTYNFQQMDYLLKRIVRYLQNYDTYVKYVKSNQWHDLLTPYFHDEIDLRPNDNDLDTCISNYAEVIKQEKEIRFLKFLHSVRND